MKVTQEPRHGLRQSQAARQANGSSTFPAIAIKRLVRLTGWHSAMKNEFKGNKQSLPSKLCAVCGRPMTWRKAWARNWEAVLYCSNACRANKAGKK